MAIALRQVSVAFTDAEEGAKNIGLQLDYRYDGTQNRRIVTTLANASDSIQIEGTLDGESWFAIGDPHTSATTPFVDNLSGPYYGLRASKTGTNGAVSIFAIV